MPTTPKNAGPSEARKAKHSPPDEVSAAGTPASAGSGKAAGLRFEDALRKLETIVEAMEAEDLPLETLLARYEEGTQLARLCQAKLAEAELKIQVLEKNAGGDLQLKPMQTPAETPED